VSTQPILALTTKVVAAYAANNPLAQSDIPALIARVYGALAEPNAAAQPDAPPPAATRQEIRRSITPDSLVSFEDGKNYVHLKRHLATRGLTPSDYRAKWGLPHDYPMVAPNYSARRSALAKASGLGRTSAKPVAEAPVEPKPKSRVKGRLSLFGRRSPPEAQ